MSTRNFWELVAKSKLPPRSGSVALRAVEPHPYKRAIKSIQQEKDWLNRIHSWYNIISTVQFKILGGILFGSPLLSILKKKEYWRLQ